LLEFAPDPVRRALGLILSAIIKAAKSKDLYPVSLLSSRPMSTATKPAKLPLSEIYDELESILSKFSPPFIARTNCVRNKRNYVLVSEKEVVIDGRKRPELWFSGVIEQKGYIGFYYMPIYCDPKSPKLSPALMKLLKGKSCFYVKVLTPELRRDIQTALRAGAQSYKKLGWV
jgi:hypothetical protein